MDQIASLWYVWLIIMVACYGYAGFNQARRMKGMFGGVRNGDVDQAFGSFGKGIGTMVAAGIIGSIAGLLFLVAVILHIASR